jgi:gamma-glutamylcyclotransferase (GGCT)/AIG2-like uncharacterized protein YtfP
LPLCFAYGSNMDADAMRARCPGASLIGRARLPRHRRAAMREGYLTVVRDPRGEVRGLLWDVPLSAMPALDRYEGVARRLYVKQQQMVIAEVGPRRALVYFGANAGPGVLEAAYAAQVRAAAETAGLTDVAAEIAALERAERAPRR